MGQTITIIIAVCLSLIADRAYKWCKRMYERTDFAYRRHKKRLKRNIEKEMQRTGGRQPEKLRVETFEEALAKVMPKVLPDALNALGIDYRSLRSQDKNPSYSHNDDRSEKQES